MKREIALRCLLGLLSLSACGGSSSQAIGNGAPPDTGGSAGHAGSSGAVGTNGASSDGMGRSAGSGGVGSAGLGSVGSAGSVGAGKPKLGCAGWQLDLTAGNPSNAMLIAGGVKLTRPVGTVRPTFGYFNSADVALEQVGLVGEFDITIGFKDFVPGDAAPFTGPRLAAGVWWHNDVNSSVYQAHGAVGRTTGDATLIHGQQFDINGLNPSPTPSSLLGASGTIRVKRIGSVVTVETTVNGQLVTAQSESTEPFTEEPLTLFIGFDDNGAPSGEPSTVESGVTITSVQVTNGDGQVKSDDFSCP